MMNAIWGFMVLAALACGAITGKLGEVSKASVDGAETAVKIAIGLVGVMALWIGLMKILEEGGYLHTLARWLRPVMRRLFPSVPADHPAMSLIILNTSANALGLSNAATPFGLKAMSELEKLNPHKGTATDAQALFLAINTAGVAVFPTTMIAARAALGAKVPGSIILPTLAASIFGTIVAVASCWLLQGLPMFRLKAKALPASAQDYERVAGRKADKAPWTRRVWTWVIGLVIVYAVARAWIAKSEVMGPTETLKIAFSEWSIALFIAVIAWAAVARGVKAYDVIVEAGKEAFDIALKIIPFLVAVLVGVAMLRASGAVDLIVKAIGPVALLFGMPPEVLPMALLRSLTGGGSLGLATELMKTHGPDTLIGNLAATIYGSSETTFYVLAVYFGSVQVRNGRHTLAACLAADAAAIFASVWAVRWMLGA